MDTWIWHLKILGGECAVGYLAGAVLRIPGAPATGKSVPDGRGQAEKYDRRVTTPQPLDEEPHVGPAVQAALEVAQVVARDCPEFIAIQDRIADLLRPFTSATFHVSDDPQQLAENRILNQALNDFLSLLFGATVGDGRSTIRSARALYEHVVNLATIRASQSEAERYMDHEIVIQNIADALDLSTLSVLSKDQARRFRRRRKKRVRSSKRAADQMKEKHGDAFRRRWSSKSLRANADQQGFDEGYRFYRLASAVMHGSAGGSIGILNEVERGQVLHRIGPALALCPMALAFGLRFFDDLLSGLSASETSQVDAAHSVIADLQQTWETYSAIMFGLDEQMWPPVKPILAVLRVMTTGKWQWWAYDLESRRVARIDEPDMSTERRETLRAQITDCGASMPPGWDEPLTVTVVDLNAVVSADAKWQSAGTVLVQPPMYIGERPRSAPTRKTGYSTPEGPSEWTS